MANPRSLQWYHENKHRLDKAKRSEYMKAYRLKNLEKWKRTPDQQAKVNARKRELYAKSPEQQAYYRAASREYHEKNPHARRTQRLRKYGITPDQFDAMMEAQGHKCAICGHSEKKEKVFPHVDHCHSTGKVRGILCAPCNLSLGKMKDSPELLERAAAYLRSGSYGLT